MEDALENSARCIDCALNLAKSGQKASIRKILEDLNHCRDSINLNSNSKSNSNEKEIENVDLEIQNADMTQSTQNAQNRNNENTTYDMEKLSNIESRIEKTIDAKMEKIQSHLESKLNQMMNLIQPRGKTTENQVSKNSNPNSLIPSIPRQYKDQNASKIASSSNSWAQVVSRNITKSAKMHEKKDFAKTAKSEAWLSKRMIAKPKNQISTINAVEYRNKINNALKMHKKVDVLVQTVQLSRTGQHIVFTTTENLNAQKLIEYRKTWENLFEFDEIKVDKKWHEAIVHGI